MHLIDVSYCKSAQIFRLQRDADVSWVKLVSDVRKCMGYSGEKTTLSGMPPAKRTHSSTMQLKTVIPTTDHTFQDPSPDFACSCKSHPKHHASCTEAKLAVPWWLTQDKTEYMLKSKSLLTMAVCIRILQGEKKTGKARTETCESFDEWPDIITRHVLIILTKRFTEDQCLNCCSMRWLDWIGLDCSLQWLQLLKMTETVHVEHETHFCSKLPSQ